jgi:hypothetical protein
MVPFLRQTAAGSEPLDGSHNAERLAEIRRIIAEWEK